MERTNKNKYLSAPEKGRHKYSVHGIYGGLFTNYQDAVRCAKFCSTTPEYDYHSVIWVDDSFWYDKFEKGKLDLFSYLNF